MRGPSIPVAHGIARSSGEPDPVRLDWIGGHFVPIAAFAVLIAAQFFDYASFLVMTARHGLEAELNPVVVAIAESFGLPGLTIVKVASVVLLAAVVVVLVPRRRRLGTAVLSVGVAAGLLGGISNIATI